ncbi:MAG: aminotransferase class V-fold PLP-dependent enzyme [Lachnospiraceae bacterium]|nr:aminotransferase class V-fold PLP-dependent enzyme [Lachnospiraceae bacterium]
MIYLNNAATSYPKPDSVKKAYMDALDSLPSGQFRSAGVVDNSDIFGTCRRRLASLMGISEAERIYFTSGSTEGLNAVISGLGIKAEQIITTVTEHNSVLRPLYNLPGIKGEPALLSCDENGCVEPELFEEKVSGGDYRAVILNHCSNVTGAIQDVKAFGEIAGKHGLIFILDASQSAGCLDIRADEWGVDALAFTGHKSLMGVQGTGGYYVRNGLSCMPLKYGGTGLDSSRVVYEDGEYEYEVGTQNAPGIAALSSAVEWVLSQGIDKISDKERGLADKLLDGLSGINGVHVIGQKLANRGPVVSFITDSLSPSDLAYILQNSYGVVTRAGLHCAPLIHKHIGSGDKGTLRVSFSYFNTEEDIDALLIALREILA